MLSYVYQTFTVCNVLTQKLAHPRGYDLESAAVSVIHLRRHRVPHSWGEHILHFSSFFCSYQATWWHKGRGKKAATARTCVGRSKRCMKIKARRQSKSTVHDCAHIISSQTWTPSLFSGLADDVSCGHEKPEMIGEMLEIHRRKAVIFLFPRLLTTRQRNDSWKQGDKTQMQLHLKVISELFRRGRHGNRLPNGWLHVTLMTRRPCQTKKAQTASGEE